MPPPPSSVHTTLIKSRWMSYWTRDTHKQCTLVYVIWQTTPYLVNVNSLIIQSSWYSLPTMCFKYTRALKHYKRVFTGPTCACVWAFCLNSTHLSSSSDHMSAFTLLWSCLWLCDPAKTQHMVHGPALVVQWGCGTWAEGLGLGCGCGLALSEVHPGRARLPAPPFVTPFGLLCLGPHCPSLTWQACTQRDIWSLCPTSCWKERVRPWPHIYMIFYKSITLSYSNSS